MAKRQEVIAEGYKYYCLNCNKVFKDLPYQPYEDGHGCRQVPFCSCSSDLFATLEGDSDVDY